MSYGYSWWRPWFLCWCLPFWKHSLALFIVGPNVWVLFGKPRLCLSLVLYLSLVPMDKYIPLLFVNPVWTVFSFCMFATVPVVQLVCVIRIRWERDLRSHPLSCFCILLSPFSSFLPLKLSTVCYCQWVSIRTKQSIKDVSVFSLI